MPQHRSASKRIRSDAKRRLRNRIAKTKIKTIMRHLREAPDEETARGILPEAYRLLDRAVKRGVMKGRTVSRRKSRLARSVKREG